MRPTKLFPKQIQSVAFPKKAWTKPLACSWLKEHGFICGKVDVTSGELRFRQFDPSSCRQGYSSWYIRSRSTGKARQIRMTACAAPRGTQAKSKKMRRAA